MDTNNQIEYHHSMSIQLRWMDADAFGHVNNTMYFQYYDTAKMDYFRKVCHEIVDKYAIVTVHLYQGRRGRCEVGHHPYRPHQFHLPSGACRPGRGSEMYR